MERTCVSTTIVSHRSFLSIVGHIFLWDSRPLPRRHPYHSPPRARKGRHPPAPDLPRGLAEALGVKGVPRRTRPSRSECGAPLEAGGASPQNARPPKAELASAPGVFAAAAASVFVSWRVSALMARRREEGLEGRSRRAPLSPLGGGQGASQRRPPGDGTEGPNGGSYQHRRTRCWPGSQDEDLDGGKSAAPQRAWRSNTNLARPTSPRPATPGPPPRGGSRPSSSDSAKHRCRSHSMAGCARP
jgi:hypothetical protein